MNCMVVPRGFPKAMRPSKIPRSSHASTRKNFVYADSFRDSNFLYIFCIFKFYCLLDFSLATGNRAWQEGPWGGRVNGDGFVEDKRMKI